MEIAKKQTKDEEFNVIIEQYYKPIFKYCYNMLRNVSETEDAVQDIFIKVYKTVDRKNTIHSYTSWIYKIAYNHCLNIKKREGIYKFIMLEFLLPPKVDYHLVNAELNELNEFSNEIEEALSQLLFEQRTIFLLRVIEEMSYEEISSILNKNVTAIRKQNERAKKKIKNYIVKQRGAISGEEISIN